MLYESEGGHEAYGVAKRVLHARSSQHAKIGGSRPPPNSSQQPTRGRSLARRFRASFCATLRVALPGVEGRARLSERTLGGLRRNSLACKPRIHPRRIIAPCRTGGYGLKFQSARVNGQWDNDVLIHC